MQKRQSMKRKYHNELVQMPQHTHVSLYRFNDASFGKTRA